MSKQFKQFTGSKRSAPAAEVTSEGTNGEKPKKNFKTEEESKPQKNFKEGIEIKKDFKSNGTNGTNQKKDFKTFGGEQKKFETKSFKPKNREWESDDENENAPGKIEAKHNKENMEIYIKNDKTIELLKKRGITYLFPIQEHCFQAIQLGKDVIGKDRTGSGKTLGFALPLIEKFREEGLFKLKKGAPKRISPLMVVVVPTRELCIQVANEIATLKHTDDEFKVLQVYGGVDVREQADKIRAGCEVMVGTPGRIIDQYERGTLKYGEVRATVLDEADQMLNFGFQEDIEKILGNIKADRGGQEIQQLLFSATMPGWVHEIANKYLKKDRAMIDLVKNMGNKTSEDVTHLAINCPYYQRTEAIGDVILCFGGGSHSRVIIFCETKNEANDIMLKANIKQDLQVLHGDIPQKQREITFQGFREGKFKCLVATNVAARGLDIPEVDLIVQLEPPKELDAYIHRSGRTGRAGKKGVCITFYTKKQIGLIERIEQRCRIKMQRVGAPQPADLVKASQNDIKRNLMSVNRTVLGIFQEVSQSLIEEFGAEEALERAIAFIAGYTEKMKQRSLLCCLEGYVTYIVKGPSQYRNLGYVWGWLKQNFPGEVTDRIKGMKKFQDSKGAVFDVAESDKEHFDNYIESQDEEKADDKNKSIKLTLEIATEIPDVEEEQMGFASNNGNNSFSRRENSGQRGGGQRVDPKLKRELEIFIGGLGFESNEQEITAFFDKNGIKFSSIKPLQGEDGKFKGIVFAMCQDHDTVQKVLQLNGQKFNSRALRINMAAKNS